MNHEKIICFQDHVAITQSSFSSSSHRMSQLAVWKWCTPMTWNSGRKAGLTEEVWLTCVLGEPSLPMSYVVRVQGLFISHWPVSFTHSNAGCTVLQIQKKTDHESRSLAWGFRHELTMSNSCSETFVSKRESHCSTIYDLHSLNTEATESYYCKKK